MEFHILRAILTPNRGVSLFALRPAYHRPGSLPSTDPISSPTENIPSCSSSKGIPANLRRFTDVFYLIFIKSRIWTYNYAHFTDEETVLSKS